MQCGVAQTILGAIGSLMEAEKTPRDYGTGHTLYHAEVKFLQLVQEHGGVNAGALSEIMGVTNGAVTQMGNRLIEKGLVERYTLAGNRKEKHYRLTEAGGLAREGHQAFHAEANRRLCKYLCSLKKGEAETIMRFLTMLGETMPICAFSCGHAEHSARCAAGEYHAKQQEGGTIDARA